jgi:formylglycine-generating enzyme required for sulfatase activity
LFSGDDNVDDLFPMTRRTERSEDRQATRSALGLVAMISAVALFAALLWQQDVFDWNTASGAEELAVFAPQGSQTAFVGDEAEKRERDAVEAVASPDSQPDAVVSGMDERKRRIPIDQLTYIRIPAGEFTMGCVETHLDCPADARPAHVVVFPEDFWITQTEVTQAAYHRVLRKEDEGQPEKQNVPVAGVNWFQAADYCRQVGGRLPTEAEWEYATRAGRSDTYYDILPAVAWTAETSGGEAKTVAGKAPNAFGLHDTLGNVWEWVNDHYGALYYQYAARIDPRGPDKGTQRVARGGGFSTPGRRVNAFTRLAKSPETSDPSIGFRCVLATE